jgi:uncharacterized protein YbjT (DUF2867 family)
MSVNVVLGAGGPTGFECVRRLLEVTKEPVRAVVRDPSKYDAGFKAAVEHAGEACARSSMHVLVAQSSSGQALHRI